VSCVECAKARFTDLRQETPDIKPSDGCPVYDPESWSFVSRLCSPLIDRPAPSAFAILFVKTHAAVVRCSVGVVKRPNGVDISMQIAQKGVKA